ncbi:hypothetical protein [Spirosoma koreense]
MNSSSQNSLDTSYEYLDLHADSCVETLLNQIKSDLESINQHIDGDDEGPLENCWDEICAQRQGEEFYSWEFYEMTIEGVIEGCFESLSHQEQLFVNFAAVQASNTIDELDYESINMDEISTFLMHKILQIALNDTNPRVQAYLDPYSEDHESNQHNLDEYVLLRIDPARRSDFLAALSLFGFVENIEIDAQAEPYFTDLLDNLDVSNR